MHVISFASIKGGVGKTTLSLLVAAEMALEGYNVALLDCDNNQHSVRFADKASIPNFDVIGDVTENNLLATLRDQKDKDLVVIDLPGIASTLALKAFQRSSLVLVPAQLSLPDVRDAFNTFAQVDDAEELRGTPLPRALVWTRIPSGFESIPSRHVRKAAMDNGAPILGAGLTERAAFKEIHMTGKVPRQTDPNGPASQNVSELTAKILELLATDNTEIAA